MNHWLTGAVVLRRWWLPVAAIDFYWAGQARTALGALWWVALGALMLTPEKAR